MSVKASSAQKHVKCQVNANLEIFHDYLRSLFENTEKSLFEYTTFYKNTKTECDNFWSRVELQNGLNYYTVFP